MAMLFGNDVRFRKFAQIAKNNNAKPCIANVGTFCFESNGSPAIYGGSFALKFNGLEGVVV